VEFSHRLRRVERVSVYPVFERLDRGEYRCGFSKGGPTARYWSRL